MQTKNSIWKKTCHKHPQNIPKTIRGVEKTEGDFSRVRFSNPSAGKGGLTKPRKPPFTKRFHFCFEKLNNFHFGRQVRKVTGIWSKTSYMCEKVAPFPFLLFSRTTSKKPSRFTRDFGSRSRRLFNDRDEDKKSLSRSKLRIFIFPHVYDVFAQNPHQNFIKFIPNTIFLPCFTKHY